MLSKTNFLAFISGLLAGFVFVYIIFTRPINHIFFKPIKYFQNDVNNSFKQSYQTPLEDETVVPMHGMSSYSDVDHGHSHDEIKDAFGPDNPVSFHDSDEDLHADESKSLANHLYKKIRVLCWIMTSPNNLEKKAKHVKATWGRRCNKLLFMSSKYDPNLPAIGLNISEGRNNLWGKTKQAFTYVYDHHLNDADWFLKADDDTYVIMENLRYMLNFYSPNDSIYFGRKFKPFVKQGYMSGGAGYVLGKKALEVFVQNLRKSDNSNISCRRKSNAGSEDVEIGKCLESSGVKAGDSRDTLGRERFMPFSPIDHIIPGIVRNISWYWKYIYYPSKQGLNCCSDTAISFHYMVPNQMYVMEYLLYHLRPYGIHIPYSRKRKN